MRHYEIVFLIHPDRSEQAGTMVESYKNMITNAKGKIHREEDWGLRRLEYPIKKLYKAHYFLMNIEIDLKTFKELKKNLDFNDDILRYLDIRCDRAITEPSPQRRHKERYHASGSNAHTASHHQKNQNTADKSVNPSQEANAASVDNVRA